MGELEGLIADVKKNKQFDAIEMEFIHARAKGLLQLLQLFGSNEDFQQQVPEVDKEKVEEIKERVEAATAKNNDTAAEKSADQPELKPEEEAPGDETDEALRVSPAEEVVAEAAEKADEKERVPESKITQSAVETDGDDDEMLEEETEKSEANSRLGDSFLKGKSVNDLITDQHKLEYKLSNRPVSSIQAAIGINDRFQYIRELFGGDSEQFLETVKKLDSMQDIKEAVDFLRKNFKWKKNETSLKFVNLVKRRFQDG